MLGMQRKEDQVTQVSDPFEMSSFARGIMDAKYAHPLASGGREDWKGIAKRQRLVLEAVNAPKDLIDTAEELIALRKIVPGGRYLYAVGRDFHQTNNCCLFRADDSREGWADIMHKCAMSLMTGAGIGIEYSPVREEGAMIRRTGGIATGPGALMKAVNELGRQVMQGGSRRSAIWAGLRWSHPDIMKFIRMKDWSKEVRDLKAKDFNFPAPMDMTNISVGLDDEFFAAIADAAHPKHALANAVYWAAIEHMLETGEPGFSVNCGDYQGEDLRNACTEVTSFDDSDICNLVSVNMARIDNEAEMMEAVEVAIAFQIAGSVYSDVPTDKIAAVRAKNRRLGLGLMGIHEWLMMRGKRYGIDADLDKYLEIYAKSGGHANNWADRFGVSRPVKTRAIAPTGTIGIVAETTTGIEPMFAAAYKRRYLKGSIWHYEYVIDPTAKRAVEKYGVKPDELEDAYSLAEEPERRVAFQAHVQKYVDHSISSTVNLPHWGSELNNKGRVSEFGNMLLKHLPGLRGITVYPDGARGGQPLNVVKFSTAMKHVGNIFVEGSDMCDITGKGGSCGS
jgi:ribonucleoside-diphosphate reductase alpha chain